ncbi:peroxiredoxin family protein [Hymenobacter jeollabukensis]|uniref:peroxiredoxin family protein n=1 Tax=Hymenobacter jeollabukensis TaxID=2025313 RepID=UPI001484F322|nr:peroxiredoxin family protein [Hymenobacter jeollabukensis]
MPLANGDTVEVGRVERYQPHSYVPLRGTPAAAAWMEYQRLQARHQANVQRRHEQLLGPAETVSYSSGYGETVYRRPSDERLATWLIEREQLHTAWRRQLAAHLQRRRQEQPREYLGPYLALRELIIDPGQYAFLLEISQQLRRQQPEARVSRELLRRLRAVQQTVPGKQAPNFSLPDTNGRDLRLADFRGRYVLLSFWDPADPYNASQWAGLRGLHQHFASRGLRFVHVSVGEFGSSAYRAALPGHHAAMLAGQRSPVAGAYGLGTFPLPHTVLIGPDGRILARGLQGWVLGQKIAEYIPLD